MQTSLGFDACLIASGYFGGLLKSIGVLPLVLKTMLRVNQFVFRCHFVYQHRLKFLSVPYR
jgi:hypothetical protein